MFVHLHQHSHYSKLDGIPSIEEIVNKNVKLGADSVAITEHGTLASTYELHKQCKKYGVKPILGNEMYYVDDYESEEAQVKYNYAHIVILCKNENGWDNLKKLQNIAWEKGYLGRPRIDFKHLKKYSEGLICTTACANGLVGQIYLGTKHNENLTAKERRIVVAKRMKKFKKVFGDDFYLEVQVNDFEGYKKLNPYIVKLSKKYDVKVILTNDVHYLHYKDEILHNVSRCIAFNKKLTDPENGTYGSKCFNLRGQEGLNAYRLKYHPYMTEKEFDKYCAETGEVASKVETFPLKPEDRSSLPSFCKNPNKKLRQLCEEGLNSKIINSEQRYYKKVLDRKLIKEYKKRLNYELKVIADLGYSDYYLIVWDIVREARKRKIPFNMRGSVCGSLSAFCCGITWIDPLRFDCPFERFLTEDRISMPDMDMDFARTRREIMIDYITEKYGEDCVAHIVNYGEWKVKGAIKDAARVFGATFQESNTATKEIKENSVTWKDVDGPTPKLNEFLQKYEEIKPLTKRMIGHVHASGVHASGIIVTPDALENWAPVAYMTEKNTDKKKQVKVTEWDMYALEDLNILKLDFLGLSNLDIVADCIEMIVDRHKSAPFHDIDSLYEYVLGHLHDKEVFKLCQEGKLVGTFQMGTSDGMRDLIKNIVPTDIEDVIASIALYRTAVLRAGMHKEFVKRKFGSFYEYLHPKMKPILDKTYGVMIYQESVMRTGRDLAGFTASEADHFRKGIKQKDPAKFAVWKEKFITGCKKTSSIDKELAEEIWQFMENFSGYGFCRSHAVSYGVLAFLTAFLKIKYPLEFMTALVTSATGDDSKLVRYLREAKVMEIKIKAPSINKSSYKFVIDGKAIRYPFTAVKQCGQKAIDAIIDERRNGEYEDLADFVNRVNKRVVNVGVIKNLILAGAFGEFGKLEEVYDEYEEIRKSDKQIHSLFCESCNKRYPCNFKKNELETVECPACGSNEIKFDSCGEKFDRRYIKNIAFGFAIENNPLKPYLAKIINYGCENMEEVGNIDEGNVLKFAAKVTKLKKHIDKNGNEMAFMNLDDGKFQSSMTVFASDWDVIKDKVKNGKCYILTGQKNRGEQFLFCGRIKDACIML